MSEEYLAFGPFRCDVADACVRRGEQALALPPKAFAVLLYLLRHPGRLVRKDELLNAVWQDTYVSDAVLKVSVAEIRKVLADDSKTPRFVETVHRRGYRFIAPLRGEARNLRLGTSPPFPQAPRLNPPDPKSPTQHSALSTQHSVVGRETELARLHQLLEKTAQGERQVVFVTGEPGIGKTALIQSFLAALSHGRDVLLASGQCLEHYGAREAYLPVLEAMGRLCREPGREGLVELLNQYAPTWLAQLPSLVNLSERRRLQHEILGATPERMLREMAEAIEVLTAQMPLVLVLEDVHWSDYATLDLIAALARRRESARLLLIASYRPVDVIVSGHPLKSLKPELHGHGWCKEISLELLTVAEVAAYLTKRFAEHVFPGEFAQAIHERTDGNPLFLVNFIDYLIAQGVLRRDGQAWRLRGGVAEVEDGMPDSIRQMIERQIERLTGEEQEVLEVASVAGMDFAAATVAAAFMGENDRVEQICEQLGRRQQFITVREPREWPDGAVTGVYGFTHSLYRTVLLQRVGATRGLRLHQRIGERLETGYGARASEIAAELAMHFEQGREYPRAIHYLQQSAEQAVRRSANHEARQYLSRALELVKRAPETEQENPRLTLLERRGMVSRAMGNMREAADDFSALTAYAQNLGQREQEVVALSHWATALSWLDRDRCLETEQRAALLSQDIDDGNLLTHVRGYTAYWNLLWRGWKPDDIHACAAAVEAARHTAAAALLGVQVGRLSFFQCLQSDYAAARHTAQEGMRLNREAGDVHNYLLCHFFLAWALLHSGQWGEMARLLRDGIAMAERNGHRPWELLFRLELSWLYIHAGSAAPAREECERGLQLWREMSLPIGQLICPILLGFAHVGMGQPRQALQRWSDIAGRLERERMLMDWIWRMPLRLGLSEYWAAQGEWEQAGREAERLCEAASPSHERTYLALGHRLLAEVAAAQRRWSEAEQQVAHAFAVLKGGDAPLAGWRVSATAARIAEQRRHRTKARQQWELSKAVLLRLADSFDPDDPLRQSFLAQPGVQDVLRQGEEEKPLSHRG